MPSKQGILPVQGNRPDGSFDGIVVDLDPTVSQEGAKANPVFGYISGCLAERRLASDAGAVMRELGPNVCDQRGRPCFPLS